MRCNSRLAVATMVLVAGGLAFRPVDGAAPATARAQAKAEPSTPQLLELARLAKDRFQPLAANHVATAKAELQRKIERLERAIRRTGAKNAQQWMDHLQWEMMQAELAKPEGPDMGQLGRVVSRYIGDHESLERPVFTEVRDALIAYLTALSMAADPNLGESCEKRLDALAEMLPQYESEPTLELRQQIGQTLGWLENARQASTLVAAVRKRNWKPNLYAEVSERFVSLGLGEEVREDSDVNDCILGTAMVGWASMSGRTSVRLAEDSRHAQLDVVLTGTIASSNVGYNRGVQIFTRGTIGVDASVPVYLDPLGFTSGRAVACCTTDSVIDDIVAKRRLIERIAWKKAGRSQPQAEQIGSRHAEARIASRMEERAAEMLLDARKTYEARFRNPLLRRGEFPQEMKFQTQKGFLKVVWRQASASQLAAPTFPPRIAGRHDVAVRVHESMVSNFSRAMIGGVKLTDKRLVEILQKNKIEVPEALELTEDKEPWSITFAAVDPVNAAFDGNTVRFAVRGRQFESGANTVNKLMEMSAVYKVEKTPQGARLLRQGDVAVDYVDARQIGNQEIVVRAVMRQKFEALFPPEFNTTGIALPGRWKSAGSLHLEHVAAQKGWLSLAWLQVAPPQATPTPGSPADQCVAQAQ